jgi:hypothetical protein
LNEFCQVIDESQNPLKSHVKIRSPPPSVNNDDFENESQIDANLEIISDNDESIEHNTLANKKIEVLLESNIVKSLNFPLDSDWEYDPKTDDKPILNFKPGSKRDEDWIEHDKMLESGIGFENSYGISLILPDPNEIKILQSPQIYKKPELFQDGHKVLCSIILII